MLVIKNGNVLTMGEEGNLKGADLLVEEGKIKEIGRAINYPPQAEVIDATGKTVIPGMIDAHNHVGIYEEGMMFEGEDVNELTGPITPEMRALDAINPYDEGIREARTSGITSVLTGPGSGNVIGGQFLAMKTWGRIIDKMVIKEPAGLKIAFGENPKRVYSAQKKSPSTRMATAALLRKALFEAKEYLDKWEEQKDISQGKESQDNGEESRGKNRPERDFQKEVLVKVLEKKIPLKAHAHRADDIMTAIRIAQEFDLEISIEHCTEGHKIARELKELEVPAVVGPTMSSRSKIELRELSFETPKALYKEGVKFAIMTDHPVIPLYALPICAAMAVKAGLPWQEALKAITINAAEIAGIDDRVGSLERGKDADLVICDGDPLSLETVVEQVFISGESIIKS